MGWLYSENSASCHSTPLGHGIMSNFIYTPEQLLIRGGEGTSTVKGNLCLPSQSLAAVTLMQIAAGMGMKGASRKMSIWADKHWDTGKGKNDGGILCRDSNFLLFSQRKVAFCLFEYAVLSPHPSLQFLLTAQSEVRWNHRLPSAGAVGWRRQTMTEQEI